MPLDASPNLVERVQQLILDSFDRDELEQLVRLKFGPRLGQSLDFSHTCSSAATFEIQVGQFLKWTRQRGNFKTLIEVAAAERPRRPEWQHLWKEVQEGTETGPGLKPKLDEGPPVEPVSPPLKALDQQDDPHPKPMPPDPPLPAPVDPKPQPALETRFFILGLVLLLVAIAFAVATFQLENPTQEQWLIFKAFFSLAAAFSAWCFAGAAHVDVKTTSGLVIATTGGFAVFLLVHLIMGNPETDSVDIRPTATAANWQPDGWRKMYDDEFIDTYSQMAPEIAKSREWELIYKQLKGILGNHPKPEERVMVVIAEHDRHTTWQAHRATISTMPVKQLQVEGGVIQPGLPGELPSLVSLDPRNRSGKWVVNVPQLAPDDTLWLILVLHTQLDLFPKSPTDIPFNLRAEQ